MRKLIHSIIAAAALLCAALPVAAQQPESYTRATEYGIAFYNLENLFDTINNNAKYDLEFSPQGSRNWNTPKYNAKLSNLARTIGRMPANTAVIGFAEAENESVIRDLVAECSRQGVNLAIAPYHESPDPRGIDVGLLYNPNLFTVLNVSTRPTDVGFATRDQVCVLGLLGGDSIAVIVNHWPSRLRGKEESSPSREKAAAICRATADELRAANPNIAVIVMGDLNDDPQDPSCAVALGAVKDAADATPTNFFNPWWNVLESGRGTLSYRNNWNLFDQIIVSGNLVNNPGGLSYSGCLINDFDFLRAPGHDYPLRTYSRGKFLNGYSDHYPTEIFLVKE